MSRKGTPYALLGLLSIEPMSGYDLRREIRETLSFFWHESYGQIYPALKRLTADGFIVPKAGDRTDGRDRQAYTITPKGRASLRAWLALPPRKSPVSDEFLLKLFLGRLAPRDSCRRHIRRHLDECGRTLAEYERLRSLIAKERGGHIHMKFWRALIAHGIAMRRAEIRWCNEALRDLGSESAPLTQRRRKAPSSAS